MDVLKGYCATASQRNTYQVKGKYIFDDEGSKAAFTFKNLLPDILPKNEKISPSTFIQYVYQRLKTNKLQNMYKTSFKNVFMYKCAGVSGNFFSVLRYHLHSVGR